MTTSTIANTGNSVLIKDTREVVWNFVTKQHVEEMLECEISHEQWKAFLFRYAEDIAIEMSSTTRELFEDFQLAN
jgi:hypothetical protein